MNEKIFMRGYPILIGTDEGFACINTRKGDKLIKICKKHKIAGVSSSTEGVYLIFLSPDMQKTAHRDLIKAGFKSVELIDREMRVEITKNAWWGDEK